MLFVPLLRADGRSISDEFEGRLPQYERGTLSYTIDNTALFLRYDFPVPHTEYIHTYTTQYIHTQYIHTHTYIHSTHTQYIHTQYIHTQYIHTQYIHTHTYIHSTHTQYIHTQYIHTQYIHTQYIHTQYTYTVYTYTVYTYTLHTVRIYKDNILLCRRSCDPACLSALLCFFFAFSISSLIFPCVLCIISNVQTYTGISTLNIKYYCVQNAVHCYAKLFS